GRRGGGGPGPARPQPGRRVPGQDGAEPGGVRQRRHRRRRRRRHGPCGRRGGGGMNGTASQLAALARRSVVRTLRQPGAVIPAIVFPLFFLAVISAGAGSAAKLPGFPTHSYFTFVLAGAFLQGIMLGGVNGGTDLAVDVESGFLNRLALTPIRRLGVVAGQLAGMLAVSLIQIGTFLAVGFAFGARFRAGVGGVFVLVALGLVTSAAFGAVWSAVALRTGSSEAIQ